jgi:hypothetical protein
LLGEAGLLSNRRATTHWATLDGLEAYGAIPVADRWVRDGNILTAAGVSAGLDAALHLTIAECGDTLAKAIQLLIEYDPSPPIDCGNLDKAGPEVVAFLASAEGARLSERKQRRP